MSSDAATDLGEAGSDPARRKRINVFVALFLAFQLITPLTYYVRSDPYDERFAWRMFSGIRLHKCETQAFEITPRGFSRKLTLHEVIHVAWITNLQRNRRAVIRAFLRRRCRGEDIARTRVVNNCITPDGTRLDPLVYERNCRTGEVEGPSPQELP